MSKFISTGFADESAKQFLKQLEAHKILGWEYIEPRMVDGTQIDYLDEASFQIMHNKLLECGIKVSCLGSARGKTPIDDNQHTMDKELAILDRLCIYANRLNSKYIRIMSFSKGSQSDEKWCSEGIARLKDMVLLADKYSVMLVLENCVGYSSLNGDAMVAMLDGVGSDNLKCAFDIGNTMMHGADPWEFYNKVRGYIEYIHVKDVDSINNKYIYPGTGEARIVDVLTDLYKMGYEGFISIEPHLATSEHLPELESQVDRWKSYIKYGTMMNDILKAITG